MLDIVVGYPKGSQIAFIQVLEGKDNAYIELLQKENLVHTGVCVKNFAKKFKELKQRGRLA